MDPSDITTQQEAGAGSPRAAPVTPRGAPPGVAIPGYVVEGLLGQGGMGAVYLAMAEALGRQVAIKIVLDGRAAKEDARARFRREARVMASVEHPNVVRLYSFGVAGDSDYLVMEYVDGETLAKRLARAGALSEDEGLKVLRQMLLGLEAAWEKGIVHRDVKPSNVMVDQKGRVLVADFGLAKAAAQDSDDSSITTGQTVLGTPHYLSPEQAQGQPVDLRSDMYSAGLVLYEMLTGERPFAAATPAAVVARRLTEPAPDIGARRPGLSTRTASIYRWMVERSPADRPGSYADLIAALDGREGANRTTQTRLSRPPVARTAFLSLPPLTRVAALCISGLAALGALWGLAQLMSAHADLPRPTIAVAPFYGPDPESAREGRVAAALIERALVDRAATTPIRVTGIEETREVVRSHEAARALGVRLNAGLVVWGEAFAFGGRTQFQPYVTRAAQVVPSRPVYRVFETGAGTQAEQSAAR